MGLLSEKLSQVPATKEAIPNIVAMELCCLKAETVPRSRSGPRAERNYPCSSEDTHTWEPYPQSPPPPFRFLLERTSSSDPKMAVHSSPQDNVFALRTLPQECFRTVSVPCPPAPQNSGSATGPSSFQSHCTLPNYPSSCPEKERCEETGPTSSVSEAATLSTVASECVSKKLF